MKFKFPLITITVLITIFVPFLVKAYPNDAITIPFFIAGQQIITLLPAGTTRTILNAHIINYANSSSEGSFIDCGSVRIAKGYFTQGYDDRQMSYVCSNEITAGSSGSTNAYGQIVYVDYDLTLNSSIEQINATNSSSTFWLDKSWDYGELFIAFLLVLILFFIIFFIVFNFFFEPVIKIRGKQ
jgi:hypothetical protein